MSKIDLRAQRAVLHKKLFISVTVWLCLFMSGIVYSAWQYLATQQNNIRQIMRQETMQATNRALETYTKTYPLETIRTNLLQLSPPPSSRSILPPENRFMAAKLEWIMPFEHWFVAIQNDRTKEFRQSWALEEIYIQNDKETSVQHILTTWRAYLF